MNGKALLAAAKRAYVAVGLRFSHPVTGVLLAFMIVVGVVLRIQNIGYPFPLQFDEHQYVNSAHQFLIGGTDSECCHPPLSKILFGAGMVILGNNPEGWRFLPLVFGLQSIVIAYLLTSTLFEDRRAGWLAAAFMAVDGFYLAYSRSGLADILLSCLMQWGVFAAVAARGWAGIVTSAVLIGLAASIKWVGLLAGLPACLAIVLLRRVPWYSMVSFALVPVVHLLVWMLGLHMIHLPNDPVSVFNTIMERKDIHLGFPHEKNPLESRWYTWPVLYYPIVIKQATVRGKIRLASSVAHPLLCFAADACLVTLPLLGGVAALRPRFRERWAGFFDAPSTKGVVILGASWFSAMLLWMTGKIVTYWYHYLTAWGFAIMLLAGVLSRFERRYPKHVLGFVVAVIAVFIYFVPVWAEFPLSKAGVNMRLPFSRWR
jgi:dolichyl-phosphate-mannose--protein O-mannosyl transferase